MLAFLTELAIFQIDLGVGWTLNCGLYSILANCAVLGAIAREMRTVHAFHLSLPQRTFRRAQMGATN